MPFVYFQREEMLLSNLLEQVSKKHPDAPALYFEGKTISYQQVEIMANRVANGLKSLGIGKGDKVAIMLPNIPEFIYSFFGIQRIAAVAVPFNIMYKGGEVIHILKDSGAKAIIALSNFAPLINEILPELPNLKHIILTGERNIIFADPETTVFIQLIVKQKTFPDVDTAYSKVGQTLVNILKNLGVERSWYKHRGSVRVDGKKIAGFIIQEVEDMLIISIIIFIGKFQIDVYLNVIWMPPEIKDKIIEPLTSIAEESGKIPVYEDIKDMIVRIFEEEFEVKIVQEPLARDELFGYEKIRSLIYKS
jgi:long-chain acyl-CoA synthetase